MLKEEIARIDLSLAEKCRLIHAQYRNNPLVVHVKPKDIERVLVGMTFRVLRWDNLDKTNPSITLQLLDFVSK